MKKESILYGIIGLLSGIVLAGFVAVLAVNNDNHSMMNMMGMNTSHSHDQLESDDHSAMSMDGMTEQLKGLSGDEFDAAFIEMMIIHHVGAVDMAELIPDRANHDEIKQLGREIISAQTKEINDMRSWQKLWGHDQNNNNHMMEGMMNH